MAFTRFENFKCFPGMLQPSNYECSLLAEDYSITLLSSKMYCYQGTNHCLYKPKYKAVMA